MMLRMSLLALAAGIAIVAAAPAADWPQWRGPKRDGASPETGLLKEWPKDGPKLLWRIDDVGRGYGSPSVVGERIYLISNDGPDDEYLLALDLAGKRLWKTPIGKVGNPKQLPPYAGARSTPTIDGDRAYALSSDGDLACVATATGKVLWRKSLRNDFGGEPGFWAYSESPLVDGEHVVVTPGKAEATIVALKKTSGEDAWKCAVPGGDFPGYASPIVIEAAGVRQYVQFLAKGVVGVEAKTGKFLWRYDQTGKNLANMATPVADGDSVFTSSAGGFGGLVRIESAGGAVVAKPVYYERGLPYSIGGALLHGGHLYGTTKSFLVCADFATGKIKWKDKCIGAASLLVADGMLYLHGEDNRMALVEATPDGYREKGRFALPDVPKHPTGFQPEAAWSYPTLAGGRLYVRDLNVLWCYEVKGK